MLANTSTLSARPPHGRRTETILYRKLCIHHQLGSRLQLAIAFYPFDSKFEDDNRNKFNTKSNLHYYISIKIMQSQNLDMSLRFSDALTLLSYNTMMKY